MSGLPRSGSTLLTALLNQNPEIHASTNSPLLDTIHYTEEYLLYNSEQYKAHPKPECAHKVLSSIPENYYFNTSQNIIVDKSRGWVNQIQHIQDYITPEPKIICPVRSIPDIISSFLNLIYHSKTTSFIDEALIKSNIEINNDNRADYADAYDDAGDDHDDGAADDEYADADEDDDEKLYDDDGVGGDSEMTYDK